MNEEDALPECLSSVSFSNDIVVLDSGSDDRTEEIARNAGATVLYRKFDNYAAQRNFGLSYSFKHEWILMIDADERATTQLRDELLQISKLDQNPIHLYRMRRQDHFLGRWIKHSSGYPTWFGRFFRKGCVRVEREINEEYHTDGEVGFITGHLEHFPFIKGVSYWIERHNRYSTMEASKLTSERNQGVPWKLLINSDPAERRRATKAIAYRIPARPVAVFLFLYLVKRGFLDGKAGFNYSLMRAVYEYMIDIKIMESLHMNK